MTGGQSSGAALSEKLVQQPIDFSDGSAIRLTIARYYTPSGAAYRNRM